MDFGIRGKTAVVTGASAGIGRAVAESLASEGANLLLCARRGELLEEVADAVRSRDGIRVEIHAADLSTLAGCESLFDAVKVLYGHAEILAANIGGPPSGGYGTVDEESLKLGHERTFLSAIRLVRGFLPGMRSRGWGRIVAIQSVSVFEPIPNLILSNAYRPAVVGFLKTLSQEVAGEGVTVNCVCPGYTGTERLQELAQARAEAEGRSAEEIKGEWMATIPAGRIGRPEEIAAAAAFLCSEAASYITGLALPVDGGRTKFLLA